MRGDKNILKKGKIEQPAKCMKGKVSREKAPRKLPPYVRVSQCCFNWSLVPKQFQVQTTGQNCFYFLHTPFLHLPRELNVILFMPGIRGTYGLELVCLPCVESLGDSQDLNRKVYNLI